MNNFTFKNKYGEYPNCSFSIGSYVNGNIGIEIWSAEEGPITKVTVNPDIPLPSDRIAIKDYSENEGMVDWLKSMDIIEGDPVQTIISGWVEISVYMLSPHGKELLGVK